MLLKPVLIAIDFVVGFYLLLLVLGTLSTCDEFKHTQGEPMDPEHP